MPVPTKSLPAWTVVFCDPFEDSPRVLASGMTFFEAEVFFRDHCRKNPGHFSFAAIRQGR